MEYDGKFLILLRHGNKVDGDTWGLPAGKVEKVESDEQTILRELEEETGYLASANDLEFLGDFHFEFDDLYVEFPSYKIKLDGKIEVKHSQDEHIDWRWVSAKECYEMDDLIRGFHDLLERTGYIKDS